MELDGRTVSVEGYRFGYQGSEKDNEFKGEGNSYTTEFRQLDPRLGRWLSVDPVIQPWQSSYCSMDNNPIWFNDQDGDTIKIVGSKKFERQVTRQIRKLMRTIEGRELVKGLHERTEIVQIFEAKHGNGNQTVVNPSSQKSSDILNIGNSTVKVGDILFDPTSSHGGFTTLGITRRPKFIGLGHEMKHSNEIIDGTINWGSWTTPDGKNLGMYEVSAVDSENKVRWQSSHLLRKFYYVGEVGTGQLLEKGNGTHPTYQTNYRSLRRYKTNISLKSTRNYLNNAGVRSGGLYKTSERIDIRSIKYGE